MKKRLLLQLLAVVFAVGAYATGVGEYLYSSSAKYKVTGANIFQEGGFEKAYNGLWTSVKNTELSSETWSLVTGVTLPGVDGTFNAMESLGAKADSTQSLFYVMQLPAGDYTFSYWVKSAEALTTSVASAANGVNYVNFYLNMDGGTVAGDNSATAWTGSTIAGSTSYGTEWKQIVFAMSARQDCYFVFHASNINTGTAFTNFEIYPVEEVYDTRIAEGRLDYVTKILAEEGFAQGDERSYLEGQVNDLKALLESTDADDISDRENASVMNDILNELNTAVTFFLNASAGNLIGTTELDENDNTVRIERYLYDWSRWGYSNWNNVGTRNGWEFMGGRWGFSPNTDPIYDDNGVVTNSGELERPAGDGYVASAGIQIGYTLDVGLRIADGTLNGTTLPAGRYMFSIEAQAVASLNKAAPYGANEGVEIKNPMMWVGSDSINFTDVVLNNTNWQKLYYIAEIKEGEEITAGFHFPVVGGSTGGRYSLRNPEFRLVGKTQDQIDHLYAHDQLVIQQTNLKARLDLANEDLAKTINEDFPWGHVALKDSIDKYSAIYNDLIQNVVAEDGTEVNPDRVTLEYKDEILAAVQAMNSARNNYAKTNKFYQKLKSDVAWCTEAYENADYATSGYKTTFKSVIDEADGMVKAAQTDVEQEEEFDAEDDKLLSAKEEYEKGAANRAHPADLDHTVVNGGFQAWSSKSTYSSDNTVNGWEITIGADGKQWDIAPDAAYENAGKASIWRGTTVGPNGRVRQRVTLTTPGVYEYRAMAFSAEDGDAAKWPEYMAIAKNTYVTSFETFEKIPVDTLYIPNVRLFFGPTGAVNDSLTVSKCAPVAFGKYYRNTPLHYSIIYVKTNAEEEEIELGLEAYDNGATSGANTFGFGANHIFYVGGEADYKDATLADLKAEIATANALIAQYKDEPNTDWIIRKLYRFMGDEKNYAVDDMDNLPTNTFNAKNQVFWLKSPDNMTIQEMQNAYLSILELEQLLKEQVANNNSETGINQATTATDAAQRVPAGIYTITGVKVGNDVKALPRGLYIINGKKVVVK